MSDNTKLFFLINNIDDYDYLSINVSISEDISYNFDIALSCDIFESINNVKNFIDNLLINDNVFQSFNDSNNSSSNISYNKGQIIFETSSYNGEIWGETKFKVKYNKNELIDMLKDIHYQLIKINVNDD